MNEVNADSIPRVLCVTGSARQQSFNTRLMETVARSLRQAGVAPRCFPVALLAELPLMNQDLEERSGIPEGGVAFKQALADADAVVLCCPEYNGSVTPMLKNAIDWASRPHDDLPAGRCFPGKAWALLSASPGALGGLRGLRHVREIITNLGGLVIPEQVAIADAAHAFDDTNQLGEKQMRRVDTVVAALLHWATLHHAASSSSTSSSG